jgi:hypothetical protein
MLMVFAARTGMDLDRRTSSQGLAPMRRLSLTALLAVPLFLVSSNALRANPIGAEFWECRGCAGYCFKLFPFIHQHGPLYNYGPYYGYYPFYPYGPWDAYLRYDPFFYGPPSSGNVWHAPHHEKKCSSCGFHHASWSHGGWFKGHKWLDGGHGDNSSCGTGGGTCGGLATTTPATTPPAPAPKSVPNPATKYSGIGNSSQSAVYYQNVPTLNPAMEFVQTASRAK